jgi:protein-S-isoprenylcysteine O-methyltransferase Ste14
MTERADNPGVRFPPPLLYVAAVVAGWLLDRQWPLSIGVATPRRALAGLLIAVAAVLIVSSFQSFWRKHTSAIPIRPATALVIAGPYRFTRNPMYVSLALLTVALGLLLNTWWVIVWLIPALILIRFFVIAPEERYLRRRFGAEYEAYTRQVRRWL